MLNGRTGVGDVAWDIRDNVVFKAEGNANDKEESNNGVDKGEGEVEEKAFPDNPDDFNQEGLVRKEYNNGKIIKWHDPKTGKAIYEWNADPKYGDHYHVTPNGKTRMPHPDTGDTHIKPGEGVPKINK